MMIRKIVTLISLLVAICFLAGPSLAAPKLKTAPGAKSGLIKTPRHIYYPDDPSSSESALKVAVVFPRNLKPVWTGDADAWLVIWVPGDDATEEPPSVLPPIKLIGEDSLYGSDWTPDKPRNLFSIPWDKLGGLMVGDYQMGLVLTVPGGDPTLLTDWYGGFSGLVSFTRLTIAEGPDTGEQETDGEPVEDPEEAPDAPQAY